MCPLLIIGLHDFLDFTNSSALIDLVRFNNALIISQIVRGDKMRNLSVKHVLLVVD